jgi:hypothetical protein
MSRLSLQVFYLWRHVFSTAPPFILWWSNFEILFAPFHRSFPFIGGLRCQAIQTEHGPYIAESTQKVVFIVRCLCSVAKENMTKLCGMRVQNKIHRVWGVVLSVRFSLFPNVPPYIRILPPGQSYYPSLPPVG